MKKVLILLVVISGLILMASCEKDNDPYQYPCVYDSSYRYFGQEFDLNYFISLGEHIAGKLVYGSDSRITLLIYDGYHSADMIGEYGDVIIDVVNDVYMETDYRTYTDSIIIYEEYYNDSIKYNERWIKIEYLHDETYGFKGKLTTYNVYFDGLVEHEPMVEFYREEN